jgi:large subunit ribosomal protein L4
MTKVDLFKQDGSKAGDIELADAVFGIEPNQAVVADAVLMQRASMRQGTHAVKNRSAVRGGGRKPWRQKGTGRARQGSIRAPQWRGGGVVNGPSPRSYAYHINRKVYQLALKSALSDKVANSNFLVVDKFDYSKPSTKAFAESLQKLGATRRTLVVVEDDNQNALLSARNIENVQIMTAKGVNVYDVVRAQKVVIAADAAKLVEGVFN